MLTESTLDSRPDMKRIFSKVPEVTLYFWIIKVLATTVGETAADYLGKHFNYTTDCSGADGCVKVPNLTTTTIIMSAILALALVFQLKSRRYVPSRYWVCVVLLSVVGTLVTDNLVDHFGASLTVCTIVFAAAMFATFGAWYASEGTLSIHSIYTTKRELLYWLAILFTFALGTAAGDLFAEKLKLGYWKSALLFLGIILAVGLACRFMKLNMILGFWIAYVLTRPLGASTGDYLSQPKDVGGLNLGTTVTSAIFLSLILAVVVYMTVNKQDATVVADEHR